MEPKKPNRQDRRRLQLEAPRRRGATPSNPNPVQPAPSVSKPNATPSHPEATPRVKKAGIWRVRQFLSAKKILIIVLVAAVICLAAWLLLRHPSGGGVNQTATKPDYQTVLPSGKSVGELGGWKRISPPEKDPVFAYADTIDGISISVSQQPLPASFKGDTSSKVAELAKKFSATNKIDAGSDEVYIGTSAKGPQSVILAKNNVLILIKSQKKISDASWTRYVQTLD